MRSRLRLITLGSLILSVVALQGCGFALRGELSLPNEMSATFLEAKQPFGTMARRLRQVLAANGAGMVDHRDSATAIVELQGERFSRTVLSVNTRGKVSEYQLNLKVTYRLISTDGELLRPSESTELKRDFTFDDQQILGKSQEDALIREDMYNTMAQRIVEKLARPLRQQNR